MFIAFLLGGLVGFVGHYFLVTKKKPMTSEQINELWSVYANNKGGIIDLVRQVEKIHGIE